ncbi:hypothetical protein PVK64_14930 [Aliivibrio sp. S4TY2]|uniref:Uncharacterized protein n=3 Tax=Aliivibrio finisterrensis TaxID=511998 RepID=A0A4Q5KTL5_9GAMM|nr:MULTISPECIES: hypothetical protein [Aliivibrio]MDD9157466.1 hypothetical protein [Aliivibrio sp. S4TY2]MDD9161340.1 hypothetical protein [Aliivibrio sp. S4TY1]MDD9165370.1 hypothetical protein [Aliivibrio sp. S4MY2]MDD9169375.1 hypothetical protein [Aliivibrio sp. S4MY4]MDD9179255.1 hypothetical protein [Aliivibrio sp. A6]
MNLKIKDLSGFRETLEYFEELKCLESEQRAVVNHFIKLVDDKEIISKSDLNELHNVVSVVYNAFDIDSKQLLMGVIIRSKLLNILEELLDIEITKMAVRRWKKQSKKDQVSEWFEAMQNEHKQRLKQIEDK